MVVTEIINRLDAVVHTLDANLEINVVNPYCGDLLSNVLGRGKESDYLITIMANLNTLAVASLLDYELIIFAEGVTPSTEMVNKANELNIILITSNLLKVDIIRKIYAI